MRLNTKSRYAVMALADMARFNVNKPISLRDISLRQGISLQFLEQIFLKLKKNNIVRSIRGTNGGYVAFSGANEVTGATSGATGTPDAAADSAVTLAGGNTLTFSDGYANPELAADSGDIIYIENRKPISRSSDQIEDIKVIVEF